MPKGKAKTMAAMLKVIRVQEDRVAVHRKAEDVTIRCVSPSVVTY
jgi:hypothetical protein